MYCTRKFTLKSDVIKNFFPNSMKESFDFDLTSKVYTIMY